MRERRGATVEQRVELKHPSHRILELNPALVRQAEARAKRVALSVVLCGDARMRALNRTWRRKDRPTDVLSFPGPGGAEGRPL